MVFLNDCFHPQSAGTIRGPLSSCRKQTRPICGAVGYGGSPQIIQVMNDHLRTERTMVFFGGILGIPHFRKIRNFHIFIHILYQLGSEGTGN